jgi:Na+/phosphate symporter
MYIQNQKFKDEETLLEQLFDFALGEASPEVAAMLQVIDQELRDHKEYQAYKASLTDEEEIMELEDEERRIRLAEQLMERYEGFEVSGNKLAGTNGENTSVLYSIDLY